MFIFGFRQKKVEKNSFPFELKLGTRFLFFLRPKTNGFWRKIPTFLILQNIWMKKWYFLLSVDSLTTILPSVWYFESFQRLCRQFCA